MIFIMGTHPSDILPQLSMILLHSFLVVVVATSVVFGSKIEEAVLVSVIIVVMMVEVEVPLSLVLLPDSSVGIVSNGEEGYLVFSL